MSAVQCHDVDVSVPLIFSQSVSRKVSRIHKVNHGKMDVLNGNLLPRQLPV